MVPVRHVDFSVGGGWDDSQHNDTNSKLPRIDSKRQGTENQIIEILDEN